MEESKASVIATIAAVIGCTAIALYGCWATTATIARDNRPQYSLAADDREGTPEEKAEVQRLIDSLGDRP